MPNHCATARLTLAQAPPTATVPPSAGVSERIERLIGDTLVALVDLSVQGLREVQEGALSQATRAEGGTHVAKLYDWHGVLGESAFADSVRRQGRLRLRHRNGVGLSEAAADEIVVLLLGVVSRVSVTMKALAN